MITIPIFVFILLVGLAVSGAVHLAQVGYYLFTGKRP